MAKTTQIAIFAALASTLALDAHATQVTPVNQRHVVRVDVSSTSGAMLGGKTIYAAKHLVDGRNWSTWGSAASDTAGAWINLQFDTVQYISEIEYVPGDARTGNAFNRCARPHTIRLEAGGTHRTLTVPDRRYQQVLTIDPPMNGAALRMVIEKVHGAGRHAGVCLSELTIRTIKDPNASIPGLRARTRAAIEQLTDDASADHGHRALVAIGPPAVEQLIAALQPDNPNLATRAAQTLGAIGDARAIAALETLTAHADTDLQRAGLWALAALQNHDHFDALRAWYQSSRDRDQDRAFDALARSGDARALDIVIAELTDGTSVRQQSAEKNLGRFGAAAITALRPLLTSSVRRERAAALRTLGTIDHPDANILLRQGLVSEHSDLRAAAIQGLTQRGSNDAHHQIIQHASSRYFVERLAVAKALGHFADPNDLDTLIELTRDDAMSIRRAAATSLGQFGPAARKTLRELAHRGPDAGTAGSAADALLGQHVDHLNEAIALLGSIHVEVQGKASAAIASHGDAGRAALVKALVGDDARLRMVAAEELKTVGARVLPELIAATTDHPESRIDVLTLVAHFGDPVGADFATTQLTEAKSPRIRKAAVIALGACARMGQPNPHIIAALDDDALEVKLAAASELGRLHITQASGKLMDMLKSDDEATRRTAIRAIGRIQQRTALPTLLKQYDAIRLSNDHAALREELIVAIGEIGGRASLPVLIDAMGDRNHRIRRAAERGLR